MTGSLSRGWALAAICGVGLLLPRSGWAQGAGATPVRVSAVAQREIPGGLGFVGTVTPLRRSTVGSAVAGRIVEFRHNEGDYVKEGEILAQVLTGTIEIELKGAEAELEMRKAELRESQTSFPAEKQQADAKLAMTKSRWEHAQAKYDRALALRKKNSVSEEAMDEAKSMAQETEAAMQEAEAARRLVVGGSREQKIEQLKAKVAVQEEAVNFIKDRLAKYTIKAYFSGYITAEHTEVGHWIKEGDPVVEIAELDNVDVRVNVPEDQVVHLFKGSEVRVEVNAMPEKPFFGKIEAIVPQADLRARTFPVLVRIKNPKSKDALELKAGMLARAILPVGAQKDALVISKDAVVLGGKAPIVYVVDPEGANAESGKVRPVPVEMGVADGGEIQVRGDLKPGQLVVVEGNERLRPGQSVTFSVKKPVGSGKQAARRE